MASKLQVTAAECRRRAAECHKMAENAPSPHVRDTLADIERMWNRLAVETEVSQAMSRLLGGVAFGPDEIAVLVGAYHSKSLRLASPSAPGAGSNGARVQPSRSPRALRVCAFASPIAMISAPIRDRKSGC